MSEHRCGTVSSAGQVREMFARIAPRYDLLNHLLSSNVDRLWRRAVARRFRPLLQRRETRALDLCCGTGDLTLALRRAGQALVIGSDFCHPMLALARQKEPLPLAEADALCLPFPDLSFDLVTVAFGFRNLSDYMAGLREMFRLLRPGGQVGILEFAEPCGVVFGPLYRFYLRRVLPRLGALISRDGAAYSYLPASVARFPSPEELCAWMREAGFVNVGYESFTGGIACLHTGTRQ